MSSTHAATAGAAAPPPRFHIVPNAAIGHALREIADALEIEEENPSADRLLKALGRVH